MDLKAVIASVNEKAMEAHNAYHAGHHERSEKFLRDQVNEIGKYFDEKTTPAGDVTESATTETVAEVSKEKPAEDPGAPAQPCAAEQPGPALPASQFQAPSKPIQ